LYLNRKLIFPVHPGPKGCRKNQFAPFRGGVNELIFNTETYDIGIYTDNHKILLLAGTAYKSKHLSLKHKVKTMERAGSKIGYIIVVLGMIILIQKKYVFSFNPIAISIQVFSVALIFWSRLTLGVRSFHLAANPTEGKLITHGPYRWLRHPIYAALIYFSGACLISFPYEWTLLSVIMITGGLFMRMILEEKSLRSTYPDYDAYCRKAKRIIPYLI